MNLLIEDWLCGAYIVFLLLVYGYYMQKDEKKDITQ